MTTSPFTPAEWRQMINAPQIIHHLLTAADRGALFTKRTEAKALDDFLAGYKTKSAQVQAIIAAQKDADEKFEGKPAEALRQLEEVGALIEGRLDVAEGDEVRGFLMKAGSAIAEAAREQTWAGGKPVSAAEEKALGEIAVALKATEADRDRRYQEAVASAARKKAEDEARAQLEAQKQAAEQARKEREAEARRQAAEQARKEREAEARKQMEEALRQREAEAQRQAEQDRIKRQVEAQRQAEERARAKAEAEAKEAAAQVQILGAGEARPTGEKALAEAEELRQKAEAMKREAEAMEREAQAKLAAAQPAQQAAEEIYVVKKGDTLSGIAKAVYGKAGRWPEIYEANKDIIKNPNLIRPGWKLRIPR